MPSGGLLRATVVGEEVAQGVVLKTIWLLVQSVDESMLDGTRHLVSPLGSLERFV
jgi:hypothetical protein